MKQLSVFNDVTKPHAPDHKQLEELVHWHLYVDGAARNNPGPAGAGVCCYKNGAPFFKNGFFLGSRTNNQAEYLALLLGLFLIKPHLRPGEQLAIFADSQLLVCQIKGVYKINNPDLKVLQQIAYKLLMPYSYTINHVLRAENEAADAMANIGIDQHIAMPKEFIRILHEHGIS